MRAIFVTGGKQYLVNENDEIFVEKLDVPAKEKVSFKEVLYVDGKVGNPYIKDAKVTGEVLKNGKNKKIKIFVYKNKNKSNRKTQGHRQPYTKVKITKIVG